MKKRIAKIDNHCHMYFAAPGAGKTTFAVKLARKSIRKGIPVYTNFPCNGALQLNCKDDLGKVKIENAHVIIDEAGLDYNNREFKSMPKTSIEWFKLYRHFNCMVDLFSQGWDDADKKIRTIATLFLVLVRIGPFTLARKIRKKVGIDDQTKQIIDEYKYMSLLYIPFLMTKPMRICFRPWYYRYFNSWDKPDLPSKEFEKW